MSFYKHNFFMSILEQATNIFKKSNREQCCVFHLQNDPFQIHSQTIAEGSFCQLKLNFEKISTAILDIHPIGIVLAHSHPAGNCQPSTNDRLATQQLGLICRSLNICLFDHLIFATDGFYSFRQSGLM